MGWQATCIEAKSNYDMMINEDRVKPLDTLAQSGTKASAQNLLHQEY